MSSSSSSSSSFSSSSPSSPSPSLGIPTDIHHNIGFSVLLPDDEIKVVASNLPDRVLSNVEILGAIPTIPSKPKEKEKEEGKLSIQTPIKFPPQHLHTIHAHALHGITFSTGSHKDKDDKDEKDSLPSHHPILPPLSHSSSHSNISNSSPTASVYIGPLCSGWLSMQKNGGKWRRVWVEYVEGNLTYRTDETAKKPSGIIPVTFCEAEGKGMGINTNHPKQLKIAQNMMEALASGQFNENLNYENKSDGKENPNNNNNNNNHNNAIVTAQSSSSGSNANNNNNNPPTTDVLRALPANPHSSSTYAFPTPADNLINHHHTHSNGNGNANNNVISRSPRDIPPLSIQPVLRQHSSQSKGSPRFHSDSVGNGNGNANGNGNVMVTPNHNHHHQHHNSVNNNNTPPSSSPPSLSAFTSPSSVSSSSSPTLPLLLTKFDELYYLYLDSLSDGKFVLKVYSTHRVFFFRCETEDLRDTFVSEIRKHLLTTIVPIMWTEKQRVANELNSLFREQFVIQINRYNALVRALDKTQFMEDELPITSTRKEKSGVLCMETPQEMNKWRDYYFVLFEGSLFYYKDSKSTTPTGFITLRYASVYIDPKRLSRSEYVFYVCTPLRTIVCRTKHAVALAEWISALENVLIQHNKQRTKSNNINGGPNGTQSMGNGSDAAAIPLSYSSSSLSSSSSSSSLVSPLSNGHSSPRLSNGTFPSSSSSSSLSSSPPSSSSWSVWRRNSLTVLQSINKLITDVASFNSVVSHPTGLEYFRKFLTEENKNVSLLEFYLATQEVLVAQLAIVNANNNQNQNGQPASPSPTSPRGPSSGSFSSSSSPLSSLDIPSTCRQIFDRFFTPQSKESILPLVHEDDVGICGEQIETLGSAVTSNVWDRLRRSVAPILASDFDDFKSTVEFSSLSEILNSTLSADVRDVIPFDPSASQSFILKVKGIKRSKDILFEKKKNIFTIGRDKSNNMVIEDSRVSRSHARVEYSDTQCEYIDLGSSCGSKLNGKAVLRAKLRPGDVIELGQSTLIFQVKKKKTFSLFER